jgi:phenylalanyl-tRNA synthetase beta subunit
MKKGINTYVEYSKYPSVVRDLSFSITKEKNLSELKNIIKENTTNVKSINFFDIYFNPNELEKLNLGIRIEFQSEIRTLTTQEIDQEMQQLTQNLKQKFNVEL